MGNAIIMYYNSNIFLEYILMGKCTSYIVRQKVNTLSLENMFRI